MRLETAIPNCFPRKRLLLAACCLWFMAGAAHAQGKIEDLAIVVNPTCSLNDVAIADLAKIFKAQKTKNPDGVKYVLITRETGSPERKAALAAIYQMSDSVCDRYFLAATFAGTIQAAPKVIVNSVSVCQFVASEPGAIGYLRASEADHTVKVLKVGGKSPGDSDYPIKIK